MARKIVVAQGVFILFLLFSYIPSLMRLATSAPPDTIEMPLSLSVIYATMRIAQNPLIVTVAAMTALGIFFAIKARKTTV